MAKKTSTPPNAVLFHHPDAVDTSRPKLMGRHAAGEGFLNGFVRHSGVEAFYCQTLEREQFDDFQRRVGALDEQGRSCHWVPLGEMAAADPGALVLPDPSLALFSWRRRATGNRGYSILGVNHTISSDHVMDNIGELLLAPLQPWDALVCTSQAAKASMTTILDNWRDYLNQRTGGKVKPTFQMPVIPLGVDSDLYAGGGKAEAGRRSIRRGLGIGEDDVVVLYMGRLSFHAKAHPTPMYLSLEEAAKRSGKRLHLIQAGWFANESIEKEFREGVRAFCPSVNGIFLDGREPDVRFKVWFAADIFTSLSDNIQETFGLTPIEAMAAGLPVVVSDWDGYRDTVRPGVDGFAIPTWMPLAQSGADLALSPEVKLSPNSREKAYDHYCGLVSQCIAVDVAAAAEAFAALAADKDLRRRMGEAGRQRARETFDWRVVVASYQALWKDLENVRNREKEFVPVKKNRPALPLRDDPFSIFASYPTATLDGDAVVSLVGGDENGGWGDRLKALKAQFMNIFAAEVLLSGDEQEAILKRLEDEGPMDVYALADRVPEERRYIVPRTVAWLAKMGIVGLAAAGGAARKTKDKNALAPKRSPTWTLVELGIAAQGRGALGKAAKYFERALESEPDDPVANNQMGELMASAGKLDAAKLSFKKALANDPEHLRAQRNLGKALFLEGDYTAAASALEHAGDLAPEDAETKYLLGVCCRYAGAIDDSLRHLEASLELDVNRADAFAHLGLVHKGRDRRDEAKAAFEKALNLDPGNVLAKAADVSLEAEDRGQQNLSGAGNVKTVGLYIHAKFHYPLLKPLFDALTEEHWPVLSADARDLADFGPQVTMVCDAPLHRLGALAPKTTTVNVRHTLAGRNFVHGLSGHADYTCVSSTMVRDEIVASGVLSEDRVWITGFAPNDPIFRNDPLPASVGPSKDRKMVLYAPTHNARFSSAQMLGERVAALIGGSRSDLSIVIKPHPVTCETRPGWMNAWGQLAARDPHVHLIADPMIDIAPYLLSADVLVSDASGVIFQYLPLDRPIVLIANPQHARDKVHFDSGAIEWRWRDVGEEVTDVADLAAAVDR
ncbi:MAG: glycosyltransferase, partial [Proteobacteria bacterium]|nr:glycosyltransferase [Pseudomonadota bacterium]